MPQGYVKLVRQVVSVSTSVFRVFFRIRTIYNRAAKLLSKTAPPRLKAETATAYTSCAR